MGKTFDPRRHALPASPWRASAVTIALRGLLLGGAGAACVLAPAALHAQEAESRQYDIPAGSLTEVLKRFGIESGLLLSFSTDLTAGQRSNGLHGRYTTSAALQTLLRQTGLEAVPQNRGGYLLRRAPPAASGEPVTLAPVAVVAAGEGEDPRGPVRGYVAKRSVTATKTDTPIKETPQSISVVTAELVEAIGATRLRDALAYTPGINIAPYGADSRYDWLYLRGFNAYTPGFYMDGLQLRNNDTWGVWRTENYALERIEILRGPSSVLYGQNSPGGMINTVSKRPSEDPSREVQLQIGNHARRQLAGDFTGPVDEDGKLLYRLIGVLREAELPAAGMPDDRIFLAPSLTWKPSDRTTLTLSAHFLRDRAGVYTRVVPYEGSLIANPNGRVPTGRFLGDPDAARFNHEQWMVGYQIEHRVDDTWTLRQALRIGSMDVDYRGVTPSGSFITLDPLNPNALSNFRVVSRNAFTSREQASSLNVDNQAQARFDLGGLKHTVLVGLDHQRTDYDVRTHSGFSGTVIDVYSGAVSGAPIDPDPYIDGDSRLLQTGLYLQDQIRFGERWVATLGGRYDSAKVTNNDRLGENKSHQTDHRFTSRAGLVYLAENGLAPYASYSESFSPNVAIDPATGKSFEPETGRQVEVGMRYQPAGRKDSYSIAAFDLTRRNMVTYDTNYAPRQFGEIQVRGVEFEAAFQPIRQLNVIASWTWTPRAEVTRSANPDEVGKQANPVSRQQASVWADYRWASGVKVGAGVRHIGSNRGYSEAAPAEVPSYTLVDAMVGYEFERWTLTLNARNLTDKQYIAQCGYGVCYYGDQRRILATASYRW